MSTYLFLIFLRNMPKDYYICKVSGSVCMPIEQLIGFCECTTNQWLLLLSSTEMLRSKPVQQNCLYFFKILKESCSCLQRTVSKSLRKFYLISSDFRIMLNHAKMTVVRCLP